tara:strand:+ start:552 stop:1271 length:720 start_codon:yes stop_codon:yes gene_type:complete
MKVLINKDKNKLVYVKDTSKDFHCEYGYISSKDLQKNGLVETNKGVKLYLIDAEVSDKVNKIKRAPQIIPKKDIGFILAECGVNNKSIVVEAGSGSGHATIQLALHAKKVYSFDIREDHQKISKRNVDSLDLKNVTFKIYDIYEGIPVKNVDLLLLDLPSPWEVIKHFDKVKQGGHIVNYSPTIPQVMDFVNQLPEYCYHVKTIELVQREWEVKGRKVRPKTFQELGHSGFLSFVRKIH